MPREATHETASYVWPLARTVTSPTVRRTPNHYTWPVARQPGYSYQVTDTKEPFSLPEPRHGAQEFAQDSAARLGSHIKAAEQAMMAAKAEALRPFGLTVAQYAVLMALFYVPGQSSAQLARAAAVTPQTMNSIVDKLADKRLVERTPSPIHGKVLVTTLTPAGQKLVLSADQAPRTIEERLGNAFSAEERETLRALLQRAVAALAAKEPGTSPEG